MLFANSSFADELGNQPNSAFNLWTCSKWKCGRKSPGMTRELAPVKLGYLALIQATLRWKWIFCGSLRQCKKIMKFSLHVSLRPSEDDSDMQVLIRQLDWTGLHQWTRNELALKTKCLRCYFQSLTEPELEKTRIIGCIKILRLCFCWYETCLPQIPIVNYFLSYTRILLLLIYY